MNKLNERDQMNNRKFERFGEIRTKARIHDDEKLETIKGDLQ